MHPKQTQVSRGYHHRRALTIALRLIGVCLEPGYAVANSGEQVVTMQANAAAGEQRVSIVRGREDVPDDRWGLPERAFRVSGATHIKKGEAKRGCPDHLAT